MAVSSNVYLHESDKAALQTLKAIPGFSQLLKTYMSIWNERYWHIINMSSNLRLSEKQMSKYYNMLPPRKQPRPSCSSSFAVSSKGTDAAQSSRLRQVREILPF